MNDLDVIASYYRYNSDVRKKYVDALENLPWDDIVKDREASFHSIRDVFLHVLDAYDYMFRYAVHDRTDAYKGLDPASFRNCGEIRKYAEQIDTLVMGFVGSLTQEDLGRRCTIHHMLSGEVLHPTLRAVLMHMIEEELQHRGELNCMFWQQNVEPPVTGFDDDWLAGNRTTRIRATSPEDSRKRR